MRTMAFVEDINASQTYLGHVGDGIGVIHELPLVHFDLSEGVDGQEELPLVSAHFGRTDPFDELGVLVDQPRLSEDVGGRVFQPLCQLSVHHEIMDVFFCPRQFQLSRDDSHKESRTSGTLNTDNASFISQ